MITSHGAILKTNRGFTLLEILVSVGVIAILVILLTANLPRIVMAAKNAKCVSNVRGTSAAIHSLAADNGGVFRSFARGNSATGTAIWGKQLLDGGYISQKKMLRCPIAEDQYPLDSGSWYWNTYAFNMAQPDGTPTKAAGDGQTYELRLAGVERPSRQIMLWDSAALAFIPDKPGMRSETFRTNITGSTDGIQLRHNLRINAVFLDGHVEALDRDAAKEFISEKLIYGPNEQL